ncbi:hypothetical protein [uncultured Roseobacter sp.]|uniref:hypothetical protein n=1 Tax=uncultured Roseobacter sp. TaxID=114847 RepID=UPI0026390A3B|nr:hypothetical protein [uncultured Roseobacter sp.]
MKALYHVSWRFDKKQDCSACQTVIAPVNNRPSGHSMVMLTRCVSPVLSGIFLKQLPGLTAMNPISVLQIVESALRSTG